MADQQHLGEVSIRTAGSEDSELLLALIRELADYEKLSHAVTATAETLRDNLFCADSVATAVICEVGKDIAGYALFFSTFSTFTGQAGLYLEDIFVRPAWRNRGLGKALFRHVAGVAVARNCPRLEWSVLDWNQPAIDFYRHLGAAPLSEWTVQRLTGAALCAAAE